MGNTAVAADRVKAGDNVHVLDGDYAGFLLEQGGNRPAPSDSSRRARLPESHKETQELRTVSTSRELTTSSSTAS